MLVFFTTVLVVAVLLALDQWCSRPKKQIKYTNLDWEILSTTEGQEWSPYYSGRIYSVVKNKVVIVYESKMFTSKKAAETYIQKICQAMKAEYGIVEKDSNYDAYWRERFDLPM